MAKIPIPFTDTKVNTDNPMEAAKTMGFLVVGFAALYFGQDLGLNLKQTASSILGLGSESNQNDGPNII